MSIKRKCECCNNTTYSSLSDFYKIGWSAWKMCQRNSKAKCYCPDHQKEFKESAPFLIGKKVSEVHK